MAQNEGGVGDHEIAAPLCQRTFPTLAATARAAAAPACRSTPTRPCACAAHVAIKSPNFHSASSPTTGKDDPPIASSPSPSCPLEACPAAAAAAAAAEAGAVCGLTALDARAPAAGGAAAETAVVAARVGAGSASGMDATTAAGAARRARASSAAAAWRASGCRWRREARQRVIIISWVVQCVANAFRAPLAASRRNRLSAAARDSSASTIAPGARARTRGAGLELGKAVQ